MTFPNRSQQAGHELAMRLRGAYSYFRRRGGATLAPLGISSDQFVLLTVLAQHGSATQQELVRRCYSDTTTLGTMVTLLESKGLISRAEDVRDGRSWRVGLTEAGEALQKELWHRSGSVRVELAALLAPDEATALIGLLDRIIEAMRPQRRRASKPALLVRGGSRKRLVKNRKSKRTYE